MATVAWGWQNGTSQYDELQSVAVGPDGSCILAGYTRGDWNGENAGAKDWVAAKLDINGTIEWRRQGGTDVKERFYAAVVGEDGSVVLVGNAGEDVVSFAAVKLDQDGKYLWEWQNGTDYSDSANAVVMTRDGAVIAAGFSSGVWGGSDAGSKYFIAFKLDAVGDLTWVWQDGTDEEDELSCAVVAEDDSVVLAGYTLGNWSGVRSDEFHADFAAVKLDTDGNELWRWQNGTAGTDYIFAAAMGPDGSVVLAGATDGAWKGPGSGGEDDFAAVKLDADGAEVWRWQNGTNADDGFNGAAAGDDGSVVLAGWTNGAWSGTSDGSYDFAAVKLDVNGLEIWRWQGGSPEAAYDEAMSVATGLNGLVVLAGFTEGSWFGVNAGQDDFAALTLTALESATLSPALTPLSSELSLTEGLLSPAPTPPSSGLSSTEGLIPSAPTSPTTGPSSSLGAVSPPPTPTGLLTTRTPSPGLPSLAPTTSASTRGATVSPALIGLISATVAVAVIVSGLCLLRTYKAKQNSNGKEDRGCCVTVARLDKEPAATSATPSAEGDYATRSGGCDVGTAVLEAANNLAQNSQFPGVSEAAMLVSTLVTLISNDRGSIAESEAKLKRCRLLVAMLQKAATVLEKVDSSQEADASRGMKHMLIEDVQDAIGDMVGLIKTYQSKRRFTQVVVSTLFKRRMEETEAVINQTFSDLTRWLHIDTAINQDEDRRHLEKDQRKRKAVRRRQKATEEEAKAEAIVSARRLRRQRNLAQIEIPEDHVQISEDILGKGGFGTVYIADYNGRNAAAKVIKIDRPHDDGRSQSDGDDARSRANPSVIGATLQSVSHLLELQAMIRLRSPYTVNVYGAITSRKDRVVLVMELLTGGDLRSILAHVNGNLPDAQARGIIADICTGMAFLHSKNTIHGDLKSANVLLDGEGRAKIGDFGTAKWAQQRDSTGLATYKPTQGNAMHMMSFAWASPEVLDAKGSSYASDVYSFGIVAWEVLSMQVPWAEEATSLDIYKRVVFRGERPDIPADAPADITSVVRACWAGAPDERPTFSEVLGRLKYSELPV